MTNHLERYPKDPEYVPDLQPREQHVPPDIAQDPELLSTPSLKIHRRFTGKPRRATDALIQQDANALEIQSPKRVDIISLQEGGGDMTVFSRTSDLLKTAEYTGVDPRDFKEHPIEEAEQIDKATVMGPQLATIRKHGASRKNIPAGEVGKTRIKGLHPTK